MISHPIREDYNKFAATVGNVLGKEWDEITDQVDTSYSFLKNIPDQAWLPLSQIAVQKWERWPKNLVLAVRELYQTWKSDEHYERKITDCEYCNGNGFFSGSKVVEVKPKVYITYRHTWRCAGCHNWFGLMGEKIPASHPLEVQSWGFKIDIYEAPMAHDHRSFDLSQIIASTGQRINPKTDRPDVMPIREEFRL